MYGKRLASMLLPRTRQADHKYIVSARGGYFQRAFGHGLAFYVRKIQRDFGLVLRRRDIGNLHGFVRLFAFQPVRQIAQGARG